MDVNTKFKPGEIVYFTLPNYPQAGKLYRLVVSEEEYLFVTNYPPIKARSVTLVRSLRDNTPNSYGWCHTDNLYKATEAEIILYVEKHNATT